MELAVPVLILSFWTWCRHSLNNCAIVPWQTVLTVVIVVDVEEAFVNGLGRCRERMNVNWGIDEAGTHEHAYTPRKRID